MKGNALFLCINAVFATAVRRARLCGSVAMRRIAILAMLLGGMAMGDNAALTAAKRAKKDEFYTQRVDIENELRHYKAHFKGKVVLCNCDDPRQSEFFKYFVENFEKLGLKKLIATCYKSQDVDLFSQGDCEHAICQVYEGDKNGNMVLDDDEVGVRELKGDGDFRSEECIEILKEADIVVTNPPFSLFREYVAQLVEFDKKFLVIGHQNAITYKEIFPLFKENKIWLGFGFKGNAAHFKSRYQDVATATDHKEGMIRVSGVMWLTNLDVKRRHEKFPLYKIYTPDEFPKYDNYDAIEVSKSADIPCDYEGLMGVPITFMEKYNPEQFELVGCSDNGIVDDQYKLPHFKRHNEPYINGKKIYKRIFIRRRKENGKGKVDAP